MVVLGHPFFAFFGGFREAAVAGQADQGEQTSRAAEDADFTVHIEPQAGVGGGAVVEFKADRRYTCCLVADNDLRGAAVAGSGCRRDQSHELRLVGYEREGNRIVPARSAVGVAGAALAKAESPLISLSFLRAEKYLSLHAMNPLTG